MIGKFVDTQFESPLRKFKYRVLGLNMHLWLECDKRYHAQIDEVCYICKDLILAFYGTNFPSHGSCKWSSFLKLKWVRKLQIFCEMCWEKILNLDKPNVIPIYIFQLLFTIVTLPSNKILDANCKLLYSSVSIIWLHALSTNSTWK